MIDRDEVPASPDGRGWLIGAAFFGFTLVLAGLLVLYVLLWNGGAHT
ncbi:MAG TPA: hypothetical protein VFW97_11675 [Acidimicrobiia bacterium]|nr:hypothetical protein [Acidimicrobiia bacterium]